MKSNDSKSNSSWQKTWLMGFILTVSIIGSAELMMRANGLQSYRDRGQNIDLWTKVRKTVYHPEGKVIVLLGASRMHCDIDTSLLRKKFPDYTIAQLSVFAAPPMYTLENLADDPEFKGIVVCSVQILTLPPKNWSGQEKYIADYQNNDLTSKFSKFENRLSTIKREQLAVANPQINMLKKVKQFIKNKPQIHEPDIKALPDRSCLIDFSLCKEEQFKGHRLLPRTMGNNPTSSTGPYTNPTRWIEDVQAVDILVQKIQSRGGKVIFVRMPTTGEFWKYEQRITPRGMFWDRFVETSSATTIHFKDVDTLKDFHCPDQSHLDYRDTSRFTSALFTEIARRNVFDTLPPTQLATEQKQSVKQ